MTEKNYIVVAVSPFYTGLGWVDENLNMTFKPTQKLIAIRIEKNQELASIRNAIRLNHLLLLEGELDLSQEDELVESAPSMSEEEVEAIRKEISESENAKFDKVKEEKEMLEKENKKLRARITALEKLESDAKSEAEAFAALDKLESEAKTKLSWEKSEVEALTVNQIKDALKEKDVNFNENEKKSALVKKLTGLEK